MKKWNKLWTIRLCALVLAAACLCGVVLAAGGGRDDPLVTLSYLTTTVTPDILDQVERKADERQADLEKRFDQALSQYAGSAGTGSGSASYTVVTLSAGQQLYLGAGCEILPRIGGVTVSAGSSPALVDVSSGSTVSSGVALTANHLYMATIADRTITPSGSSATVLVRGEYVLG